MSPLMLLLLLCFGVDASNPLLPGSQRFNPEECIEGVNAGRLPDAGPIVRVMPRPDTDRLPSTELRRARRPAEPEAPARRLLALRSQPRGSDPPPPAADDH